MLDADLVLGLDLARPPTDAPDLPASAADLLERRAAARVARDYATADRLRTELADLGVTVTDGPGGQTAETR